MTLTHVLLPAAIIKDGQADWGYLRVVQSENGEVVRVDLKAMGRDQMPQEWHPFCSITVVNGRIAYHIHSVMKGTLNAATGTITPEGPDDQRAPKPVRDAADLRTPEMGEDPPGPFRRSAPRPFE